MQLSWNPVGDDDLSYYSIYRSEEINFDPSSDYLMPSSIVILI